MQFRVLGPLEVDAGEGPIPLGGPKQRAVLANLLVRANQVVPADTLIDDVWGDEPPEQARNTLQTYVSNLRRTLGDERLQGRSPGYVLLLEPFELDAARFDSLVRDAEQAMSVDPSVAVSTLADALDLWRGPALADLARPVTRSSLVAEAARLDERRLEAQEQRVEGLLATGDPARAAAEVATLVTAHPLREGLWALEMLALYRAERQAEALNAFQRAREILAEELGIDPSPELARLHERILQQDPELDLRGEPLRGYRLMEKLGEGPDGTVFRAIQPQVGRDVAVKVFRQQVASDAAFVQRFERDAQAAAALEHPHIVPIYDYWREPGGTYVVTRYLRGGSLESLHDRGERLDPGRRSRVFEQVADAVAFAHQRGVVHGALSRPNVLFDGEGNAYVGDFLLRSETAGSMQGDIAALCLLARDLFERSMPERLERFVTRVGSEGGEIDAAMLADAARPMPSTGAKDERRASQARNPYKGLRAFAEPDAVDFFGRTTQVDHLLGRLSEDSPGARFIAIVGPSGGGKSSLVRAGLVPAIRRGGLPGCEDPFIAEMLPGARPIEELEAALLRVAVGPVPRLNDLLRSGSRGLLHAVSLVVPSGAEVILLVDQFEELFTRTSNERDRELFLESLRVASVDPESRIRVVVTLRADFYDRPLVYPRFGELLAARSEAVPPLTPDEMELAIRRPVMQLGIEPDPELDAAVIADVAHQPGGLPLLQYALTELFERRTGARMTLASYREIGGVAGALSMRAERLYLEADERWQRAVRQVFLRLVTLGEGSQDTRRRVARSELDPLDASAAMIDDIVDTFGQHRLLTFDREPSTREPTVEIAHEALLRAWARLGTWIDEAREDLRQDQTLARAADEWFVSQRDTSFLLTGARLEQTQAWAEGTDLAIRRQELEYLKASVDRREADRRAEEARRDHESYLERRSRMRLRGLVAVFAVAAVVAAILTIIATDQRERASGAARIASARKLAAQAISNLDEDPEGAVLLAVSAVNETRMVDGSVLPEAEEALHRAIQSSRVAMTVPGVGGAVDWSPAGTFAAVAAEPPGTIVIGDGENGEVLNTIDAHDGLVTDLELSTDGSRLASTGEDGSLQLWDTESGELVGSVDHAGIARDPSFSADGSVVAAVWPDPGVIAFADPSVGSVTTTRRDTGASRIALSPDGRNVATVRELLHRTVLTVMDVETGAGRFRPHTIPFGAYTIEWSPDGRYLATGGIPGPMIWDPETGERLDELPGHPWVDAIAWSPDSSVLVTAGDDAQSARVWTVRDGAGDESFTLSSAETEQGIGGVGFSPDGTKVMAGATDLGALKVWDLSESGNAEWANLPTAHTFGDVGFLPDGRVAAAGVEGDVRIHDVERDVRSPQIGPAVAEHSLSLSPDGGTIAVAYGSDDNPREGKVQLWNTATGARLLSGIDADNDGVGWSPDGRLLAIAATDRPATLVMDRSGIVVAELPDQDGLGTSMARFSPDGALIATIGYAGPKGSLIAIWDWRREELVRTMQTDGADGLTFDRSGRRIVTMFGPPVIWDVLTGSRIGTLDAYPSTVGTVAFSPDGHRVAATGSGGVIMFDADTRSELMVIRSPDLRWPWRLAFSADGSKVATQAPSSLGGPGIVRVLALDIDDLLDIARREVTRPLTAQGCLRYWHVEDCSA